MTSVFLLARCVPVVCGLVKGNGCLYSYPRYREEISITSRMEIKTFYKGEVRYTCLGFTAKSAQSLNIYRKK